VTRLFDQDKAEDKKVNLWILKHARVESIEADELTDKTNFWVHDYPKQASMDVDWMERVFQNF
jgi:hypothetical protein